MSTILFDSPVFGPVKSRRLGVSLGINLLPASRKICSFDCIYCECGFNGLKSSSDHDDKMPSRAEVASRLESTLKSMAADGQLPDVITFAGNGEPTLHPDFQGIMIDTARLRDAYAVNAKIAVLSNATRIADPHVLNGLALADDAILKIDAGTSETVHFLDRPAPGYDLDRTIADIKKAMSTLGHRLVIQTMFVKWHRPDGSIADNTSGDDLIKWLDAVNTIRPERVMIYTIARDTASSGMLKVDVDTMNSIADKIRPFVADVAVSG